MSKFYSVILYYSCGDLGCYSQGVMLSLQWNGLSSRGVVGDDIGTGACLSYSICWTACDWGSYYRTRVLQSSGTTCVVKGCWDSWSKSSTAHELWNSRSASMIIIDTLFLCYFSCKFAITFIQCYSLQLRWTMVCLGVRILMLQSLISVFFNMGASSTTVTVAGL